MFQCVITLSLIKVMISHFLSLAHPPIIVIKATATAKLISKARPICKGWILNFLPAQMISTLNKNMMVVMANHLGITTSLPLPVGLPNRISCLFKRSKSIKKPCHTNSSQYWHYNASPSYRHRLITRRIKSIRRCPATPARASRDIDSKS